MAMHTHLNKGMTLWDYTVALPGLEQVLGQSMSVAIVHTYLNKGMTVWDYTVTFPGQ